MLVECDNEINMIVTDAIINYLWGEPECFFRNRLASLSGQCTFIPSHGVLPPPKLELFTSSQASNVLDVAMKQPFDWLIINFPGYDWVNI